MTIDRDIGGRYRRDACIKVLEEGRRYRSVGIIVALEILRRAPAGGGDISLTANVSRSIGRSVARSFAFYTLLRVYFRRLRRQIASRGLHDPRRGISAGLNKSAGRALTPDFTASDIYRVARVS